jgi:uncharacterized Tic20 family protein
MPNSTADKLLALVAHLGFLSGVGFIFAPLIIWLLKKDSSSFVAHHAKQALVWQGAIAVFGAIFSTLGFVLTLVTAGLGALLVVPAACLLGLILLIPSVIAGIKVFSDQEYSYPITGSYANKL